MIRMSDRFMDLIGSVILSHIEFEQESAAVLRGFDDRFRGDEPDPAEDRVEIHQ